jgi:hypothetical protein
MASPINLNMQPYGNVSTPYDSYVNNQPFDINQDVSAGLSSVAAATGGSPSGSGLLSSILGGIGGVVGGIGSAVGGMDLGTLANTAITGAGYNELLDQLKSFGVSAREGANQIGQQAAEGTRFVPFTVTSSTGAGAQTQADGSTAFNLSPQEQALQNMLFGGASQFYQQAQQPIDQTEQEIFNRLQAIADPARERERLATEQRLAAQGRLGTSSAAYGGATPEMLAMATAQQETLNQMALQARQQALAEQVQNAKLGEGMLSGAYVPQAALLNTFQQGMGTAGIADLARRQAAQLQAEAQMAGLDAQLQAQLGRANLGAQGIASLAAGLGGVNGEGGALNGQTLGGLWESIKDLF